MGLIFRAPGGTLKGWGGAHRAGTPDCAVVVDLEWGDVCRGEDAGEAGWGCKDAEHLRILSSRIHSCRKIGP